MTKVKIEALPENTETVVVGLLNGEDTIVCPGESVTLECDNVQSVRRGNPTTPAATTDAPVAEAGDDVDVAEKSESALG